MRYSQTVPIELHPWSGKTVHGVFVAPADMERWPGPVGDQASCPNREAGDVFDFTWTDADGVSRTRSGVEVPRHDLCDPPGTELVGDHLAAAAVVDPADACRSPTEIKGRRASRWHFFDTLCAEAEADGIARDPSVYFDASDYAGVPQPGGPPTPPACQWSASCECPTGYTDGGDVGQGRVIRKHRMVWKQAGNVVGAGSGDWSQARVAVRCAGGSSARTKDCLRQNFENCYKLVTVACNSSEAAGTWGVSQSVNYSVDQHTGYRARVLIGTSTAYTGLPGIGYGIIWEWGNLDAQTLSGTATVTGNLVKRVYHPHSGGREELESNSCTYVTGLTSDDGCNWGGMSEDRTCI